jgi:hypothetical protein
MMNCEDFERAWQELDDPSLLSPAMEDHRTTCAPCAARIRDINRIRWEARQLIETEEPPNRLWLNLRRELDKEGLIREPGRQSWLSAVATFGWLPCLPMGLAYASVFLLALVGVDYMRDRVTPSPSPASLPATAPTIAMVQPASQPAAPAAEVAKAEAPRRDEAADVPQVIRKAPSEIRRVIENASPARQALYFGNAQRLNPFISQLESSKNVLEEFLVEHPDDPDAPMQIIIIDEQRLRLWHRVIHEGF